MGPGEGVKPRLSQALTRGARPNSNSEFDHCYVRKDVAAAATYDLAIPSKKTVTNQICLAQSQSIRARIIVSKLCPHLADKSWYKLSSNIVFFFLHVYVIEKRITITNCYLKFPFYCRMIY